MPCSRISLALLEKPTGLIIFGRGASLKLGGRKTVEGLAWEEGKQP